MNLRLLPPFLLLCVLTANSSFAQSADGFTVQKRAGLALVKPQTWSDNDEATVLEFQSFTDRTVKSAQGITGYFVFDKKQPPPRQVQASRVVELLLYPVPSDDPDIQDKAQRDAIAARIKKIQTLMAAYPATRTYLAEPLKFLTGEVAQYDSGKIKVEGKWVARAQRQKEQAQELAGQLKVDILRAKPVHSLKLEEDPRFISLRQLSETDATIEPMIRDLFAFQEKAERNEERQNLLQKLASKETSFKTAELAITTLKTLQPEEDPRCVAFLQLWESSLGTQKVLNGQIEIVTVAVEDSFKDLPVAQAPPSLPAKVMEQVVAVNKQIRDYRVTNPPPQLDVPMGSARALASLEIAFPTLHQQFDEKRFFEAKDTLDGFAAVATDLGPNTVKWTGELKDFLQAKADAFSKLRDEAKLLANSGKPGEALAKYEQAYAIIPDQDVAQQIQQLKPNP